MNECEHAFELGAYCDDEMPQQQRARFEEHLRNCPHCAGELAAMKKLSGLLAAAAADEITPQALSRAHQAVERLPSRGVLRLAEALTAAAAAILVACLAGLFAQSRSQLAGGMPVWETQAASGQLADSSSSSSEELMASWMVSDLSGRAQHD